ncbi:MAG: hypothetical protein ACXACY_10260 [Candidatus Hodarchaeales archaeon]|jgi:hypothetical protein
MVANNTNTPKNISWLAQRQFADVDFKYTGLKIDRNNISLSQIELVLISDTNNLTLETKFLTLVLTENWLTWDLIFNIGVFIVGVVMVLGIVLWVVRFGLNLIG